MKRTSKNIRNSFNSFLISDKSYYYEKFPVSYSNNIKFILKNFKFFMMILLMSLRKE